MSHDRFIHKVATGINGKSSRGCDISIYFSMVPAQLEIVKSKTSLAFNSKNPPPLDTAYHYLMCTMYVTIPSQTLFWLFINCFFALLFLSFM